MTSLMELSKRIEELERQNQDHISERRNLNTRLEQQQQHHISEQRNLNAQLAILQPIIWRILTDAYLSIKGYRSSSGARSSWISTNIVRLLPPTGTTAAAFEQKLASYRKDGDICAHSTQTLAIALAVDAVAPPDEDLVYMFTQCFGHSVEEELNGKITSTSVAVGKDGIAHLQTTPSPIP
ncbi:hypothetical protein K443DRAFT_127562 [Laccaria amethystina LaAM-08-1]|uniref:Uncharacterized protein n=1 Tax=Laccaria amethystina LaAM-08-1 TaxID=1095629 RepID=A0A0C9YM88_9AGAR|nr:hypothetical protein K443DRAFT_127562 [Laccaria amethystina LaAM-08-1]